MRKYNAKPQRICSFFIILLGCSESNCFFFFFQEKRKVDLFIYEIHTIRLCVNHFRPHVKEWNRLAIRSSIKYRETRLKNMSTWKTKVLSKQPNIYTFNSSRFFFYFINAIFGNREMCENLQIFISISHTRKKGTRIFTVTPDKLRMFSQINSVSRCFPV